MMWQRSQHIQDRRWPWGVIALCFAGALGVTSSSEAFWGEAMSRLAGHAAEDAEQTLDEADQILEEADRDLRPVERLLDRHIPRYVSGELIVKLTPEAGAALAETLETGRVIAAPGLPWLDPLLSRYGVTEIQALFPDREDLEGIKQRYPERARRAPPGAVAPTLRYIYKFRLGPNADVQEAAQVFSDRPEVVYAEPNDIATTQPGLTGSPTTN